MLLAIAVLLGLGLALLLLPVLIAVEVERPAPLGPVNVRLSWGFLLGGAGLQLRFQDRVWSLHPLVLRRHLPFPRLRLQEPPAEDEAPAPATGPVPGPPPLPKPVTETGPAVEPERSQGPAPTPPAAAKPAARVGLGKLAGEFWRPGLRLVRQLAQTFHLRRLRLSGRFGLQDPAATGQAFGYLQAARGVLPRWLRLELSPDFVHQGVQGKAQLAIHFYLGQALYLVIRFSARLAWRWRGLRKAARRAGVPATTPSTRRHT